MAQHLAKPTAAGGATPAADAPTSRSTERVVVHGSDVHVERAHFELPLAEARSRFGGLDLPAALGGTVAALGTGLLLSAVAGAVASRFRDVDGQTAAVTGLVTALVVLALSALAGGWVTGRAARFDGGRNGLLTGLLLVLLLAGLTAAGTLAAASAGSDVDLGALSVDGDTAVVGGAALAVAVLVSLLAGLLGGRLGARWHRDVDDVVVGTRPGSVLAPHRGEVLR